jgi:hypothetical protein
MTLSHHRTLSVLVRLCQGVSPVGTADSNFSVSLDGKTYTGKAQADVMEERTIFSGSSDFMANKHVASVEQRAEAAFKLRANEKLGVVNEKSRLNGKAALRTESTYDDVYGRLSAKIASGDRQFSDPADMKAAAAAMAPGRVDAPGTAPAAWSASDGTGTKYVHNAVIFPCHAIPCAGHDVLLGLAILCHACPPYSQRPFSPCGLHDNAVFQFQ